MQIKRDFIPNYRLGNAIFLKANFVCDAKFVREPEDEDEEDKDNEDDTEDEEVVERDRFIIARLSDLPTIARRGVEAARAASTARMSSSRTSASEKACAAGSGHCDFICDGNEVEERLQMSAMTQSVSFGFMPKNIADFVPERVDNM
ncbi:conserved hypothetical protein [Histoplasma capsulatum var. duboisii H88]|uniref:Uncharacterized protein n=1 Tax=Ajellomyces capsulatus (strain H88) TaxID=544711 RepID=F0UNP6_AJEC8|nr:conserved hypothetical protein [Histoplasma capsulatum var. duboisii H88]